MVLRAISVTFQAARTLQRELAFAVPSCTICPELEVLLRSDSMQLLVQPCWLCQQACQPAGLMKAGTAQAAKFSSVQRVVARLMCRMGTEQQVLIASAASQVQMVLQPLVRQSLLSKILASTPW